MFDKTIEFIAQEDYFARNEDLPSPIKLNIPEWFKNLNHSSERKTIKGCIPFLDTLTSGYLLKVPVDIHIKHNVDSTNDRGESFKDAFQISSMQEYHQVLSAKFINLNSSPSIHSIEQVEGSPLVEKNKKLPFHKILNPWTIKTPEGYSCLFVPPLNNSDDRFSIISGIVDTDTFQQEINFPIVINGDKYPVLDTVIKKGTPYVQVIPFKRDNWKMKLKSRSTKDILNIRMFYTLNLVNIYKNKFWNKKSWK